MKRSIELGLGDARVSVDLPARMKVEIFEPRYPEPCQDVHEEILNALRHPIGPPLESLVSGANRVLVIVSDRTRVTGAKTYLPLLANFLLDCGLSEERIDILVATGMHELAGRDGLPEFLPEEVLTRFTVTEHDCLDKSTHFHAGRTSRGNEVYLNSKAAEADLVLITGGIGLHYFAGYRGGRKAILPGIARFETISANHRLTLSDSPGFHPCCKTGSLEGNPVHEDMLEALGMIPRSFVFNTITDARGNILRVFAGDPVKAHLAGCECLKGNVEVRVPVRADCVIVSCGGYPRDSTMVQSHKAMDHTSGVLKEGGPMIVLAENRHGMGSEDLLNSFGAGGPAETRKRLTKHYTFHAHTALSIMEKVQRFRIYLISALGDEVVRKMGFLPVRSVDEAVGAVLEQEKGELLTYVFPEGSETLPVLARAEPKGSR